MLSGPVVPVAAVEVVAIEADVEIVGVVELKMASRPTPPQTRAAGAKAPNIRISLQASGTGAICTENLVEVHTFVRNRRPAPGRISTLRGRLNEGPTNLAVQNLQFMTLCIISDTKK